MAGPAVNPTSAPATAPTRTEHDRTRHGADRRIGTALAGPGRHRQQHEPEKRQDAKGLHE